MTKLAFMSDLHLNFLSEELVINFARQVANANVDAIVISGDISEGQTIQHDLQVLESIIQRPIYFVCGNHDFYGDSIENMNKLLIQQQQKSSFLKYLPNMSYESLSPTTAIVGHNCWYDGFYGEPKQSSMFLNDWRLIKEFTEVDAFFNVNKRLEVCRKLAETGMRHIHNGIKAASRYAKKIIVVSHFVPFPEAHYFRGRLGDKYSQPWYVSRMLGDLLVTAADTFPNIEFVSLCGHTHGECTLQKKNNLNVIVAGAEYTKPKVQCILNV